MPPPPPPPPPRTVPVSAPPWARAPSKIEENGLTLKWFALNGLAAGVNCGLPPALTPPAPPLPAVLGATTQYRSPVNAVPPIVFGPPLPPSAVPLPAEKLFAPPVPPLPPPLPSAPLASMLDPASIVSVPSTKISDDVPMLGSTFSLVLFVMVRFLKKSVNCTSGGVSDVVSTVPPELSVTSPSWAKP